MPRLDHWITMQSAGSTRRGDAPPASTFVWSYLRRMFDSESHLLQRLQLDQADTSLSFSAPGLGCGTPRWVVLNYLTIHFFSLASQQLVLDWLCLHSGPAESKTHP